MVNYAFKCRLYLATQRHANNSGTCCYKEVTDLYNHKLRILDMPQAPYPIGYPVTRKASVPRFSGGTTGLSIIRLLDYDFIFKHCSVIHFTGSQVCPWSNVFHHHQEYRFYSKVLTGQRPDPDIYRYCWWRYLRSKAQWLTGAVRPFFGHMTCLFSLVYDITFTIY